MVMLEFWNGFGMSFKGCLDDYTFLMGFENDVGTGLAWFRMLLKRFWGEGWISECFVLKHPVSNSNPYR